MTYIYFLFFAWLTTIIIGRKGWPVVIAIVLAIVLQLFGHVGLLVAGALFISLDLRFIGEFMITFLPILRGIFAMGVSFVFPRTRVAAQQHRESNVQKMMCPDCGRENAITTIICPQCGRRRAEGEIVEFDGFGRPKLTKSPDQTK